MALDFVFCIVLYCIIIIGICRNRSGWLSAQGHWDLLSLASLPISLSSFPSQRRRSMSSNSDSEEKCEEHGEDRKQTLFALDGSLSWELRSWGLITGGAVGMGKVLTGGRIFGKCLLANENQRKRMVLLHHNYAPFLQ